MGKVGRGGGAAGPHSDIVSRPGVGFYLYLSTCTYLSIYLLIH